MYAKNKFRTVFCAAKAKCTLSKKYINIVFAQNIGIASPADGGNLLNWITANEQNLKGYEIERYNPTDKTWQTMGFFAAKGKATQYDYLDSKTSAGFENLMTQNAPMYYRLKMLDNDNTFTYSKTVTIDITKILRGVKFYCTAVLCFIYVACFGEKRVSAGPFFTPSVFEYFSLLLAFIKIKI